MAMQILIQMSDDGKLSVQIMQARDKAQIIGTLMMVATNIATAKEPEEGPKVLPPGGADVLAFGRPKVG